MIQKLFAQKAAQIVTEDPSLIGLAVGGSWLTNELDEFSDLDLILITKEQVSGDKDKMFSYAKRFGHLLTGFTGEHVGEPRVLICLYDDPLLHVDIKFVTLPEFHLRIETPVILADRDGQLKQAIQTSEAKFPYPDYQWIEDRFWIWIHYGLLKIGRGEYFEALDFLAYLRMVVLGPLLHIKNGNLPRGVRKIEMQTDDTDVERLKKTLANHDRQSLLVAVENAVAVYKDLRAQLFNAEKISFRTVTEERVMMFLQEIKTKAAHF